GASLDEGVRSEGHLESGEPAARGALSLCSRCAREGGAGMTLDEISLLAEALGTETMADVEDALTARGLTLGFDVNAEVAAMNVSDWIARGSPGAISPFADPADHIVAGLVG